MYPKTRLRRTRSTHKLRALVRETDVSPGDLVYPIFVDEKLSSPRPIPSMPGISQQPLKGVVAEAKRAEGLGITAVMLFGLPKKKDARGSQAYAREGVVQKALRKLREQTDLLLIADLCLCEYTSHGHCGVVVNGRVHNDTTLELYAKTAVSQAEAGADMIAPSGMMDGMVSAIRTALDSAGMEHTPIMSYSAKFASAFYGPFRDAAESAPAFGDRRSHQMDSGNLREALREIELDVAEGADIVMVKPALPYLDVIREARREFNVPIAAYSVSGEYAMLKAAGEKGWLDYSAVLHESMTAIRRAGADIIVSYSALDYAKMLAESRRR
jgi:porphobilinogen synthase